MRHTPVIHIQGADAVKALRCTDFVKQHVIVKRDLCKYVK